MSSLNILLLASLPIQLYLVDTFAFAASALSAASVSRLSFIFIHSYANVFPGLPLIARIRFPAIWAPNVRGTGHGWR